MFVENKPSRLSVVGYQITKINGFLRKGWRNGGEASARQASENDDKGELIRQTLDNGETSHT
jgi:hypothetical protein